VKEIYKNKVRNLPHEEWKQFSTIYYVSNKGRVKSRKLLKNGQILERLLKQFDNGNGYLTFKISENGKRKNIRTNRAVAIAFIPNDDPNNKTVVNHKDENKQNNNSVNLEWLSFAENNSYGTRIKRMIETRKKNKELKAA